MCISKSARLALEGFDRLTQLRAERHRSAWAANRGSCPRDAAELDHARAIRESAKAMYQRGYTVVTATNPADGPLVALAIIGPTTFVWADTDLYNLIEEAPEYASISDYALSVHEQFIK